MKKYILAAALLFGAALPQLAKAQAIVNVNIGSQPLWGPTGYDRVDYYYLPDIETYYSVNNQQYIYQNDSKWVFVNSLPSRYASYNLYNGYKVVINSPKPYLHWNTDRVKYAQYKGKKGQPAIRYSKDTKYTQVIHANKNGIPPGQAKKIVPGTRQTIVVAGSNGKSNGNGNGKGKAKGGKH